MIVVQATDYVFITKEKSVMLDAHKYIRGEFDSVELQCVTDAGLRAERIRTDNEMASGHIRWGFLGGKKSKPRNTIWWLRIYKRPSKRRYYVISLRYTTDESKSVEQAYLDHNPDVWDQINEILGKKNA